jgi:ankyrin repeat protein
MADQFKALISEIEKLSPNFNKVLIIIRRSPEVLEVKNGLGRYVLHEVCLKGAPLKVVSECIKGNRGSVQQSSRSGWYPLHFACFNGISESTIRLLVKQYPAAVREKDLFELYALHYACECKLNFAVVALLLNEFPAVLQYKNSDTFEYVLHHACRYCECEEVLLLLISSSLHAVKCKNSKGETALDIARKRLQLTRITLVLEELMERSDEELEHHIAIPRIVVLHELGNLRHAGTYEWIKEYNAKYSTITAEVAFVYYDCT